MPDSGDSGDEPRIGWNTLPPNALNSRSLSLVPAPMNTLSPCGTGDDDGAPTVGSSASGSPSSARTASSQKQNLAPPTTTPSPNPPPPPHCLPTPPPHP